MKKYIRILSLALCVLLSVSLPAFSADASAEVPYFDLSPRGLLIS